MKQLTVYVGTTVIFGTAKHALVGKGKPLVLW